MQYLNWRDTLQRRAVLLDRKIKRMRWAQAEKQRTDEFVTNPEAALNKLLRRPKRGPLRFLIGPDQSPLTTFEHMNAAITAHYTSVFSLPCHSINCQACRNPLNS